MGRKRRDRIEFRFYEIPQGQSCLALLGDKWIMIYGENDTCLHFHNLFEIGYCRNGNGDLILDEKSLKYENHMFTLIPANYPHSTISREANFWEYLFVDVEDIVGQLFPGNPSRQREVLQIINKRADLLYEEQHKDMAELVLRIIEEMRDKKPYYVETTQNLLKSLVLMVIRHQSSREDEETESIDQGDKALLMNIRPALEYMDNSFANPIKASELAECCNMSETTFRRVFDEAMNMSPMDYLNLVRVQKACMIMNKTDHSMEVVASEVGFATFSTFNRNFRKFLNTSPYQWKKNKDNYVNKLLDYNISALKGW